MVCFVVALYSEAKTLLKKVENLKEIKIADKRAYTCTLSGVQSVIAISGIGKVSAALTTQLLIDKFAPDLIVNFGTCGGVNDTVKTLNYYLIDKCCQYDFDLSELDDVPVGYIQDYDCVYFNTCDFDIDFLQKCSLATSDRFTNKDVDVKIVNDLNCSLCDMEGGAIAQVCASNNMPLLIIKGVSDLYGSNTAPEQFFKNLESVGENFPTIIEKAVKTALSHIKK